MGFDQVEKDVHPLRGRKIRVVLLVRAVGVRKTCENLNRSFHAHVVYHDGAQRTARFLLCDVLPNLAGSSPRRNNPSTARGRA
jgi:hypothetical protein